MAKYRRLRLPACVVCRGGENDIVRELFMLPLPVTNNWLVTERMPLPSSL
jgi:hypothetical protein